MRRPSVFFSVMLLILVCGCSTLTEQDIANLKSPNAAVKRDAIEGLSRGKRFSLPLMNVLVSKANEKRAYSAMAELLRSGKEPEDTELSIIKAVGQLDSSPEVPVSLLVEKLKRGTPAIRAAAIETLGKTKSEKALPELIKLLEDEDETQKCGIIWALGEIGDPEAIPTLNRLLDSKGKYVRYNAHRALTKIRTPQQVENNSNAKSVLDIGRMAFRKYQMTMMAVFKQIAGFRRA